jgi:hypothetical protein
VRYCKIIYIGSSTVGGDGLYLCSSIFAENGKNINCIFTSLIKHTIIEFIKMPKTAKILSGAVVWRLKEMYTLIG